MVKKLTEFNQIIGQANIVKWFKSCIEKDRLPQVIMLQGPAGIGKSTLAKIVACEIACRNAPSLLEETKKSVILEDKSTTYVRLYNMSNLKSQDAVLEVKSDLAMGFTPTGRKVIIMDEAHGMSDEAQDSLLTTFESLPQYLYVIVCTTEVSSFRDAFLSRCVPRRLTHLTPNEMKQLIRNRIEENNLTFEIPITLVNALIINYTGREPRRALNLLDSFEKNSKVSKDELETFFRLEEADELVKLLTYLFNGEILNGLDFIENMEITNTTKTSLLEYIKIANGSTSTLVSRIPAEIIKIKCKDDKYTKSLTGFIIDVVTCYKLNKQNLSGYFLKWCNKNSFLFEQPVHQDEDKIKMQDLAIMNTMLEVQSVKLSNGNNISKVPSLDELFSDSETID